MQVCPIDPSGHRRCGCQGGSTRLGCGETRQMLHSCRETKGSRNGTGPQRRERIDEGCSTITCVRAGEQEKRRAPNRHIEKGPLAMRGRQVCWRSGCERGATIMLRGTGQALSGLAWTDAGCMTGTNRVRLHRKRFGSCTLPPSVGTLRFRNDRAPASSSGDH